MEKIAHAFAPIGILSFFASYILLMTLIFQMAIVGPKKIHTFIKASKKLTTCTHILIVSILIQSAASVWIDELSSLISQSIFATLFSVISCLGTVMMVVLIKAIIKLFKKEPS